MNVYMKHEHIYSTQGLNQGLLHCRQILYHLGKIPWRRPWQSIPACPGESHGQRSLAGYSPWGRKDTTE